ncbi:MAG: 6-phosphofructokinase, partial [Chitinivibrionales bacterium]|nr:6-phosphofructokinase [Chitinivibrionales bacterium]
MRDGAIGIITGGGDCGGLNAIIRGAGAMALSFGRRAYLIPNGYAGLCNLEQYGGAVELSERLLETVDPLLAGSMAGNARVKISKIKDREKYEKIRRGLARFGIGSLIIAGGDDTGGVLLDLAAHGIRCIHVPKTMDLDLHSYAAGGDSAVGRIAAYVSEVKTTGRSHNRIMVLEVFGRYAGHTAFRGGIAGDADCILIPEIPVDFDVVYDHMKSRFMRRVRESPFRAGTYIIVTNEGIHDAAGEKLADESVGSDAFGHKKLGGSGRYVRQALTARLQGDLEMREFYREMGIYIEDMNALPEFRESVPG